MESAARTPVHLWIVGGLSALWNAFGAYDYVMTQTRNEAYLAGFTEAQRAYFESFPALMEAAWACGVWAASWFACAKAGADSASGLKVTKRRVRTANVISDPPHVRLNTGLDSKELGNG